MGANDLDEYWVPEHVKDYLRKLGFVLPLDDMEPWIRSWDDWMSARGDFYDYRDYVGSYIIGTRTAWGECTRCTGDPFTLRCASARSGVPFS